MSGIGCLSFLPASARWIAVIGTMACMGQEGLDDVEDPIDDDELHEDVSLVEAEGDVGIQATGSCIVPFSGCETGAVPASNGRVWIAIGTGPVFLCAWRVRDTVNWKVVRQRTTLGAWTEPIDGLSSWYRLELTNCRTGASGLIWN